MSRMRNAFARDTLQLLPLFLVFVRKTDEPIRIAESWELGELLGECAKPLPSPGIYAILDFHAPAPRLLALWRGSHLLIWLIVQRLFVHPVRWYA